MSQGLDRREIIKVGAAAVLGSFVAPGFARAAGTSLGVRESSGTRRDEPLFRVSLAEWSFHRALQSGGMDHLDFARKAKEGYGIEAVEYVNTFFKDKAKDAAHLAEMKKRCDDLGVRSLLIMCDGEGAIGDPDAAARARTVENHKKWAEAARALGCHSIRVNAHSEGTPAEQMERAADGLRKLAEFVATLELNVIVENHGGLSSNGAWLVGVMKRVDHPRCGTLPDFGNFSLGDGKEYDRYQGTAEMMPYAKAVSAKSWSFDDKGDHAPFDYRRLIRIVLDAGYHGHLGIEYEGDKHSEDDGVRLTRDLLLKIRDEMAAEARPK